MFKVFYKKPQVVCKVYSIQNDNNGYPHFLIRYKNQWRWRKAKLFIPLEEVEEYMYNYLENNKVQSERNYINE